MKDLPPRLGIIDEISVFLSQLSFWWLVIGLFLILARMPTPGMRMVDKKKYYAKRQELNAELASSHNLKLLDRVLLYCGRYFFIYHYYRNDLVFLWVIGGALFLKLTSLWMGGL